MSIKQSIPSKPFTLTTIITLFVSCAIAAKMVKPPQEDIDRLADYNQMEVIRRVIVREYPNDDLYFLGQSLTWVGEIMRIRNETEPTGHTIQYVAFSEDFLEPDESNPSGDHFSIVPKKLPSKSEEEAFEKYLDTLGMHPSTILTRFKKFGRRTVIIDYVSTGKGMSSFIYFILRWAKKEEIHYTELANALQFFIIKVDDSRFDVNSFHINNDEFVVIPTQLRMANRDTLARISLPESVEGYVRLVPFYPSRNWNSPPGGLNETEIQRRDEIVRVFRRLVDKDLSSGVQAVPTLVLRAPAVDDLPAVNLELPSTSSGNYGSCPSRFKRDLTSVYDVSGFGESMYYLIFTYGTNGVNTLNRDVLRVLIKEYVRSSTKISFMEFVKDKVEDPMSMASRILRKACDKLYSKNYYATDNDELGITKNQGSCNELDEAAVLLEIMDELLDDQNFYGYIERNSPYCSDIKI